MGAFLRLLCFGAERRGKEAGDERADEGSFSCLGVYRPMLPTSRAAEGACSPAAVWATAPVWALSFVRALQEGQHLADALGLRLVEDALS